jgi:enoyl-CoA hydratase/carnithine racemase
MSDDELLYRVENGVGWITLNRPQAGNALTPTMRDRIRDIVESFNGGYEVRAAVITAAGDKMFCPGADIKMDRTV